MRRLLIIISLLLMSMSAIGQYLNGIIVDASTYSPLAYAYIVIKNTKIVLMSDVNGKFSIKNVPKEPYTIIITYVGYESKSIDIIPTDTSIIVKLENNTYSFQEITVYAKTSNQFDTLNYIL